MKSKLLPKEIADQIPKMGETDSKEMTFYVKFFSPYTGWTWYAAEWDGKDIMFGYVEGFDNEWGTFSLSELESWEVMPGVKGVERDKFFKPTPATEIAPISRR